MISDLKFLVQYIIEWIWPALIFFLKWKWWISSTAEYQRVRGRGKMMKLCEKKTYNSMLYTNTSSRSYPQPLPLSLSLTHRHACTDTQTDTHTPTNRIRAGQRFVHVNRALNGLWNRLGRWDSVSTLWIAKQIQLGLSVININNRLTLFFSRLNIIFYGTLNESLPFRQHSFRRRPGWSTAAATVMSAVESS